LPGPNRFRAVVRAGRKTLMNAGLRSRGPGLPRRYWLGRAHPEIIRGEPGRIEYNPPPFAQRFLRCHSTSRVPALPRIVVCRFISVMAALTKNELSPRFLRELCDGAGCSISAPAGLGPLCGSAYNPQTAARTSGGASQNRRCRSTAGNLTLTLPARYANCRVNRPGWPASASWRSPHWP